MTLKHLKIFITVYQEMSITHAAEKLHMTQPAVTRSIQEIENYYGVSLFERMNHRLYKTESGNRLYAGALHIVGSFEDLEKEMSGWSESGVLSVGGNITLGNTFLPSAASLFQKAYPKQQLKITISNSALLQQSLLNNHIDIALIEGNVSSEYLSTELLSENRLLLIMPKDHPLKDAETIYLEDLSRYPILLRETGSSSRAFLDHIFAFHGISITPMWESMSTQAIIRAVISGLGISILPEPLVADPIRAGLVAARTVEDESFIRKNYIVWHQQKRLNPSLKSFITICHTLVDGHQESKKSCK